MTEDQAATVPSRITDTRENFNCIRATINNDGDAVSLQIWLAGIPGTWIEYDVQQLDGLIELLRDARAKLAARNNP